METKKLLIIILISGLASVMGVAAYAMFGERLDGALPVMNTLSSEEFAGVGYTSMTAPDDSDMWEEDDFIRTETTAVPDVSTEITVSFPLDINTATVEELMQIDGIGNVTAESIVEYRGKNGYFYSLEDLLKVEGIGEKRLAYMSEFIYIDPEIIPETDTEESVISETEETYTEVPVSEEKDTKTETVSVEEAVSVFPLDLNTASAEELMLIDGIGQALADNIVAYAEKYGFNEVDDLLNVSGIGEKKLKSISPYVYVGTAGGQ